MGEYKPREKQRRHGIETLDSGVQIDWDAPGTYYVQGHVRDVKLTCFKCGKWRTIRACGLWEYRQGKKKICWECHKKDLASKNSTRSMGRSINHQGYIVRSIGSFSKDELEIIGPMMRYASRERGGRKASKNILEHRALLAISLRRPLSNNEVVHHRNGLRQDNRIENLELFTPEAHGVLHKDALNEMKTMRRRIEELELKLKESISG